MAELTPVQRADALVKRGQTEVEQKRIRNVIDEFAKLDGRPELSNSEIAEAEDGFKRADDGNDLYSNAEVKTAERYMNIYSVVSNVLRGSEAEKKAAKESLVKIREPEEIQLLVDSLVESYWSRNSDLVNAIVGIGAPAVDPLIGSLSKETRLYTLTSVIEVLVKINDKRSKDPIKKFIEKCKAENNKYWWLNDLWIKAADSEALNDLELEEFQKKIAIYDRISASIKQSQSSDTYACARGNYSLGAIDDKYAVDALIDNLSATYYKSPGSAAMELAKKKDPRVLDELIKALDYSSRDYFWCMSLHSGVARALAEIGDKKAIDPLKKCLKNTRGNFRTVGDLVNALDKLGGKEVVPALAEAIKDIKMFHVRKEIALLLAKYDDPVAKKAVMKVQTLEKGQVDEYMKIAEDDIIENLVVAMWGVNEAVMPKIEKAIVDMGEPAFKYCLEAIEKEGEENFGLVLGAIRALGAFKDKRAVEPLIKVMNKDESYSNKANEGADALGRIRDKMAVLPLMKQLGRYDITHVVKALGNIGPEAKEALPKLKEALAKETKQEKIELLKEAIRKIEQ